MALLGSKAFGSAIGYLGLESVEAPPLEINLELDKFEPLPTCNKDNAEIILSKMLPLTRARDFLKSITSFVGLIKPFSNPDISLYYTLTRKRDK